MGRPGPPPDRFLEAWDYRKRGWTTKKIGEHYRVTRQTAAEWAKRGRDMEELGKLYKRDVERDRMAAILDGLLELLDDLRENGYADRDPIEYVREVRGVVKDFRGLLALDRPKPVKRVAHEISGPIAQVSPRTAAELAEGSALIESLAERMRSGEVDL